MVYPRVCPGCGATEPSSEQLYSTRATAEGGTRSPWHPELPGRILDLRCSACWALIRWDYFGSRMVALLEEGRASRLTPPSFAPTPAPGVPEGPPEPGPE